jgi:conjugative transfer region protein TrbK
MLGRAVAYVVLAVALLAAAVTLNDAKYPVRNAGRPELSTAKSELDAELARCKAIGLEAAAACKALWEANRDRFFRSSKPYPDRLTNTATTDSKAAAVPTRVDPDRLQRSPTTQNSPARPGDTTGRLK